MASSRLSEITSFTRFENLASIYKVKIVSTTIIDACPRALPLSINKQQLVNVQMAAGFL
jgi:hypothetical protein